MKKLIGLMVLAVAFGMMPIEASLVFAAESGVGHYVPGAMADFMDVGLEPGLAVFDWYNHYNGSAGGSRQIEFGGIVAVL